MQERALEGSVAEGRRKREIGKGKLKHGKRVTV